MARFVLSNRRAGKFEEAEKIASRRAAAAAFEDLFAGSSDPVGRLSPADETAREVVVFDADPVEVAAKLPGPGGDVIVEPEILHYPSAALPLDVAHLRADTAAGPALAGQGVDLDIRVEGPTGEPLEGAEALLFLRGPGGLGNRLRRMTDAGGKASFQFSFIWSASTLIVTPAGDHWPMIVRGPRDNATVTAPRLPDAGPLAWWHEAVGRTQASLEAGQGVRIGVADTGVGLNPDLAHVGSVGSFLDAAHDETAGAGRDVEAHGTHVSGIIGARPPQGSGRPVGVAPGADLFMARVFRAAGHGANQADIASAIDALSRGRAVDLINLSLTAERASDVERDAIRDALERGTLCICAAGNSGSVVQFPAAFTECVAVSALGYEGWGPPGSLATNSVPTQADRFGVSGLYLASFSCFGPEIDATAPGVGIISTVPEQFGLTAPYGALDGTSMASPLACGVLSVALSRMPDYRALPRDLTRSGQARAVLRTICVDAGLARQFQGQGIPRATSPATPP